jgi:hypothetical protein
VVLSGLEVDYASRPLEGDVLALSPSAADALTLPRHGGMYRMEGNYYY